MDEMEWMREDAKLVRCGRDKAVDDLIGLVGAVDGLRADAGEGRCGVLPRDHQRAARAKQRAAVGEASSRPIATSTS